MNGEASATSLPGLIDLLVEPVPPEPVSLAPQTAGWWVLGALVLTALAYGLWRAWAHWHANVYRRAGLAELRRATTAAEVATILRRVALAAYPRAGVASLTGEAWLGFLERTGPGAWTQAAAEALIHAPYRAEATPLTPELEASARTWIRRHDARLTVTPPGRPAREVAA